MTKCRIMKSHNEKQREKQAAGGLTKDSEQGEKDL